jgi:hypothetical protein
MLLAASQVFCAADAAAMAVRFKQRKSSSKLLSVVKKVSRFSECSMERVLTLRFLWLVLRHLLEAAPISLISMA